MNIDSRVESIAIGSFDGIHIAHRELISLAQEVVVIEKGYARITPGYKRVWYCDKPCAFYEFEKIKVLTAQEFISLLKRNYPLLKKIVVGYDFQFGKNRAGNSDVIRELFEGETVVIDEVTIDGISVHSGVIAKYISEGNIKRANLLLGREYAIDGIHTRGQGIGERELVATINIEVEDYILPKEGVYITETTVDNKLYPSISFIGHRDSTDGSFAIESHILNQKISNPKSSRVFIKFHSFVRDNIRFDSLKALKKQILEDINEAKEYFLI